MRKLFQGLGVVAAVLLVFVVAARAEEAKSAANSAEKYTLRYKFQPGQMLRWDVVHRAKVKTTISGTTQTAETVSQSVKAWRVKDVRPDGTATFEHSVESVDMTQKLTGRQEVRYNSKTDKKVPLGFETMAQSVGVPLSLVTLDNRGTVLHRQRFAGKGNSENEAPMTIVFSEDAVAVGGNWSLPAEIDVPLANGAIKRIKTEQKFVLESVQNGIATIQVSTQILTPIHDPSIEAMLIQRESAGTVRFDIDAGRVIGQQMDLDKKVVGFRGEASSLHYITRFTEEFLPEEAKTASRSAESAEKAK
jgi:hypothetical protein